MRGLDKRLGGTGVSRYHGCFLVMIDDDDGGRQMFDFRLCTVVSSWQRCLRPGAAKAEMRLGLYIKHRSNAGKLQITRRQSLQPSFARFCFMGTSVYYVATSEELLKMSLERWQDQIKEDFFRFFFTQWGVAGTVMCFFMIVEFDVNVCTFFFVASLRK